MPIDRKRIILNAISSLRYDKLTSERIAILPVTQPDVQTAPMAYHCDTIVFRVEDVQLLYNSTLMVLLVQLLHLPDVLIFLGVVELQNE